MDKKLAGLIGLFFVGFVVFVSLIVFSRPIAQLTRADNAVPSGSQSLMFAWPLKAKADGKEMVNVDVFIRSSANTPIANKQVVLQSSLGTVTAKNATSDKTGKATFSVTSNTAGSAQITAGIDSTKLEQSLTIAFE